jgi:hypothetical protein
MKHEIKDKCELAVTCNTIASPTQQSSSPSRGIPCSHKRGNDDRVTAVQLFHQEWRKCRPKARLSRG